MAQIFKRMTVSKIAHARTVENNYQTGAPPVLVFDCKDIPDITRVAIKCTNNRAVRIANVRNTVTVRVYNDWINYLAVVGGIAVTSSAAGNHLEYAGGPFNDDVTVTRGEVPDGSAMTIEGVCEGT